MTEIQLTRRAEELAESWVNGNIGWVLDQIYKSDGENVVAGLTIGTHRHLLEWNKGDADSFSRIVMEHALD